MLLGVAVILLISCRTAPPGTVREEGLPAARRPEATPALPESGPLPRIQPSPAEASEPPAETPALPDEDTRLIEHYLRTLSLPQKIGQRLIGWVPGTEPSERSRRLIQEGYVAGIILSAENIRSREQMRRLTAGLQAQAAGSLPAIGLLIGVDQEGGRVSRVRFENSTRFPAPSFWGEYEDPQYIESAAYVLNRELRHLGCNLNFAPVLDLYDRADGSIVGDRSMGADPLTVGRFGLAYLSGARRAGITPVVKHFPGHGQTTVDSHQKLPQVQAGLEELMERDLLPFRMAVDGGAEAVMTAHILYPGLDPGYPATLSRAILQGLLRDRLGFRGVVISDDIGMGALTGRFSIEEVLLYSLQAGVDLVLMRNPPDILKLEETVLRLIGEGKITEAEIDEGLRRVLRLKLNHGLLPPVSAAQRPE